MQDISNVDQHRNVSQDHTAISPSTGLDGGQDSAEVACPNTSAAGDELSLQVQRQSLPVMPAIAVMPNMDLAQIDKFLSTLKYTRTS